ncbi:hypothetical protein [Bradyrhizobium liaoningense]|nr:hypothetical protein [Bradyrhizobium liaoningense]
MYRSIMAICPDALPTDPAALTEMMLALELDNLEIGAPPACGYQ